MGVEAAFESLQSSQFRYDDRGTNSLETPCCMTCIHWSTVMDEIKNNEPIIDRAVLLN